MTRVSAPLVAAVLVCALSAGCSMKFAYNNLDTWVRWGLSDYVNLNDEQRAYFDAEFARLHHWHRTRHLPLYADFIEAALGSFEDGAEAAELAAMENTVRGWADEIVARGMPLAVEILLSLTDQQVERLPARLERANEEIAEPEIDRPLEEVQRLWRREFVDAFERFAGRLTRAQALYVELQSVRYVPEREQWAEYRRRWQADFLRLLQQRDRVKEFAARFEALAAARESYYGAELAAVFARNEALLREMTAWLISNLTERQRDRMAERLGELAADFRDLAESSGTPPVMAGVPCLVRC